MRLLVFADYENLNISYISQRLNELRTLGYVPFLCELNPRDSYSALIKTSHAVVFLVDSVGKHKINYPRWLKELISYTQSIQKKSYISERSDSPLYFYPAIFDNINGDYPFVLASRTMELKYDTLEDLRIKKDETKECVTDTCSLVDSEEKISINQNILLTLL